MEITVPKILRSGLPMRPLRVGIDLPSWFVFAIKSIDSNLHFVYHPYKVMYDDIMNADTGAAEDPRFRIGGQDSFGNQEIWGFVVSKPNGDPAPDNAWHIWRLAWPQGWAHITRIDSREGAFLRFCRDRLFLADQIVSKYGPRAWTQYQKSEQELARQNKIDDLQSHLMDTTKENKWLLRKAMENFERGIVAPTNPTKEVITSYKGQTNKTKIERPITDEEGGLISI